MAKTIEQSFIDWEAHVFGFGYGTGEPHTLAALKTFMATVGKDPHYPDMYDYRELETALGATVAWLLINALCDNNVDIIEYGTSPRGGWLTEQGIALKNFMANKSVEELVDLCCDRDDDYVVCYPTACNCGPGGYDHRRKCANPFWKTR